MDYKFSEVKEIEKERLEKLFHWIWLQDWWRHSLDAGKEGDKANDRTRFIKAKGSYYTITERRYRD